VAYGIVVLAVPSALPTFMADGGMVMPAWAAPMGMQRTPARR